MTTPRILVLDIETKPALAYTWRFFDVTIGLEQVVDHGGILCVGAKWIGEKTAMFASEWEHGHEGMLKRVHKWLQEADAVVTYNGDSFDLAKLNGEFLLYRLPPVGPTTSIDLYKTVRKMGFTSKKLDFIGPALAIGKKVKHEGFSLWRKVLDGDDKAQLRMTRYCLQDVSLTEKLYKTIRPYIKNHPHLGTTKGTACGACGGHRLHSRGYRRTKAFRIQRLQCQSCGAWSDGSRTKMTL